MSNLIEKLTTYAQNNLNCLIVGSHGIGKSMIVKGIAEDLKLNFKYYSASTLDPYADLIGIPTPDKENNCLQFYRPKDLENAEFLMFDEINRAHPRVLNAILEIVQFKSVNGYKLPKLKMVWAAMNPPGEDYQVEELDPALIDRFHVYIKMKAEINVEYLATVMKKEIANMVKDWWENILDKEQQRLLTPRRVEYIGMLIDKNIPWRDAIPQGHTFPVEELSRRVKILNNEQDDIVLTKDTVLEHYQSLALKMKSDASLAIPVSNIMRKFSEDELYVCRDLLESMPKDLVMQVGAHKFAARKRLFKDMFTANNIDISKYPKIAEAFSF